MPSFSLKLTWFMATIRGEVAPEDRHKMALVSPLGLFQYFRLPFGLAGAPGTFKAVIEDML